MPSSRCNLLFALTFLLHHLIVGSMNWMDLTECPILSQNEQIHYRQKEVHYRIWSFQELRISQRRPSIRPSITSAAPFPCSYLQLQCICKSNQLLIDNHKFSCDQKSIPTNCQGLSGNSIVPRGSGVLTSYPAQILQDLTISSISLLIPGHQTDCLARLLHFTMPWCPWWILFKTLSRITE